MILSDVAGYTKRFLRDSVDLELHPYNMNREDGLTMDRTWNLFFASLERVDILLSSSD